MSAEPEERLIEQARSAGVQSVYLQFTDVAGTIKLVTIPIGRLPACIEGGVWFDGSAVEGRARVVESDLYLRPDLATFAVLPWESTPTARLICDLCLPSGEPFEADPRQVLKSALAEAVDRGLQYRVAAELEFFVFRAQSADRVGYAPLEPADGGGYFGIPSSRTASLCQRTARAMEALGFGVAATHHEVAPGQQEIDLADLEALAAADALVALKWTLRAMAAEEGLIVSFMPKPLEGEAGSGLHLQQMLVDPLSGADAFLDSAEAYQLSAIGRQFVAGQIAHARGACAVVAPLVNSYKRLTGGFEAPAAVSWARSNPGALIRVPEATSRAATRVEFRAADAGCNPYLALAVLLRSGLDGIQSRLPLPDPMEAASPAGDPSGERAPDLLPVMLGEALEELDWDPVVRSALGQPVYERFVAAREREWAAYRRHISLWELQAYLTEA